MMALSIGNVSPSTPQTYSEAVKKDQGWIDAIKEELEAHKHNQTWELVPRTQEMEIIDSQPNMGACPKNTRNGNHRLKMDLQ
ncbi:hypothetical protein QE152_g3560 [Popillia japonica]|uniref:Uncharacterized protein n=1 Tax=Popillia japonica TaxID=7064 RepID=A0AAW1N4A7_POPJA